MTSQRVLTEHVLPTGVSVNHDFRDNRAAPNSLGEALRAAGMPLDKPGTGSDTPSEEDYDVNVRPTLTGPAIIRHRRTPRPFGTNTRLVVEPKPDAPQRGSGVHIVPDDDKSIQEFLKRSSQRAKESVNRRRPGLFSDFVFTRQFSAFDRQNPSSVNSPFHGFYTLFWLGVALFVCKIFANNWRTYGNPLGTNDIMKTMFSRDGL